MAKLLQYLISMILMVFLTHCKPAPKTGRTYGAGVAAPPSGNSKTVAGDPLSQTPPIVPAVGSSSADSTATDPTAPTDPSNPVAVDPPLVTPVAAPTPTEVVPVPVSTPVTPPAEPVVISTPAELKVLCDTPALAKNYDFEERFPEPPVSCAWASDSQPVQGNLGKKDQRISARLEEWRALKLPKGALLCDLKLSFLDANGQPDQQMRYDDEIFILFDDFILASSKDYNSLFGKRAGLPIYNWANLAGAPYKSDAARAVYCIDGAGTCAIPKTETKGILNLAVSKETTRKIALESGIRFENQKSFADPQTEEHAVGMVTIGDNDYPQDCKHSPLYFKVHATYVLP